MIVILLRKKYDILNKLEKEVARQDEMDYLFKTMAEYKNDTRKGNIFIVGDFNERKEDNINNYLHLYGYYNPYNKVQCIKPYTPSFYKNVADDNSLIINEDKPPIVPCKKTNITSNEIRSENAHDLEDSILDYIFINNVDSLDYDINKYNVLTFDESESKAFEELNLSDHFPIAVEFYRNIRKLIK